jgi:hypothetical protein
MNLKTQETPFLPLSSRGNYFADYSYDPRDLEAGEAQAFQKFKNIADLASSAASGRVIQTEDRLDITIAPHSFFGTTLGFIFTEISNKEKHENKVILEQFQAVLLYRYGTRVTDFAFPTLRNYLSQRLELNAATVKQVLDSADLFEEVLNENEAVIQKALVADAAATLACNVFDQATKEHTLRYEKAKSAAALSEEARNEINQFIDGYIQNQKLFFGNPEAQALEALKNLWRPAVIDADSAGASNDLELFENITPQTVGGDRFILNQDENNQDTVIAAPRMLTGWTGAAFQLVVGRDENSAEENRLIIIKLKESLVKKYGYTIANFAFPSAEDRIKRRSRLDAKTIAETLKKAEQASDFLNNSDMAPLINQALSAHKQSVLANYYYEQAKIELQRTASEKNQKLTAASEAYFSAEQKIFQSLSTNANKKNITINNPTKFLSLWLEEARSRFKNHHIERLVAGEIDDSRHNSSSHHQPILPPAFNPNFIPVAFPAVAVPAVAVPFEQGEYYTEDETKDVFASV